MSIVRYVTEFLVKIGLKEPWDNRKDRKGERKDRKCMPDQRQMERRQDRPCGGSGDMGKTINNPQSHPGKENGCVGMGKQKIVGKKNAGRTS